MIIEFFFYVFIVGSIIAALAYFGDRYEREPLFRIFNAIILGITSTLVVVIVKKIFPFPAYASNPTWGNTILVSYLSAGFMEELAKFAVILCLIYKWDDFNEYYDGPLYVGLVGIGFAISENLGYMLKSLANLVVSNANLDTNFLRLIALKSLVKYRLYPGHFLFGFIAGYFIAKAKFKEEEGGKAREGIYICIGFVIALFLHGTFNTIAIRGSIISFLGYVLFLMLIVIFIGWKSLRKSVFKKDILEKLPERKRNRLKEILLSSKKEKITFGYVFLLGILIIVYQFFIYFVIYIISIL
ncbi:MAG: PrsW family intramembrane metalloprotease [Candidatus Hydrogenedentota bacterium]|nr:MAG: PrsW family intramembrane metalloprotease [Candidatus Hydrogenedentota bacterium]